MTNYGVVQNADGTWTITDLVGLDGIDTLTNIEQLQFADDLRQIGTISTSPTSTVNHVPTITSSAQTASLTEWSDLSASEIANTAHVASGAITYSDADAGDVHTATFAAQGTGYLGTFSLDATKIETAHSISWSFSVSDSAIDYLKTGQTLTQLYNISVDDGHGGTATQAVTITLRGANDATKKAAETTAKGSGGDVGAGVSSDHDKHGTHGAHDKHNLESIWDDQAPAPASELTVESPQLDLISVLGQTEPGSDSMHNF